MEPPASKSPIYLSVNATFGDHCVRKDALSSEDAIWPYTVKAVRDTHCFQVSKYAIRKIVLLKNFEKESLPEVFTVLKKAPIFCNFEDAVLEEIAGVVRSKEFTANAVIYR